MSPDPSTPTGYVIRSGLIDTLDIFEINRKESARLLLEYPKWNLPGTFKPKPGSMVEHEPVVGKDWQLDSTVLEVKFSILIARLHLTPKLDYYWSLLGSTRVFSEVHLLHRSHYRTMQIIALDSWSRCREVDTKTVHRACGIFGCRSCT